MKAESFLQQAFFLDKEIKVKEDEIRTLKSKVIDTSNIITYTPIRSLYVVSNDDLICKLIDYEEDIKKDISRLIAIKKEITNTISELNESKYRTVLYARYVTFKTFEEIAIQMGYSIKQISRYHKVALQKIDEVINVKT